MKPALKILLVLTLCLVISCSPLLADPAADEPSLVKSLVAQLSDNLAADRLQVKIGPLTIVGTKLSSRFADNLLTMIQMEMNQSKYKSDFVSIERATINRSSLTRGISRGSESRGSLMTIGAIESGSETEALLTGTYQEAKDKSTLQVRLRLENGAGETISAAEALIRRSAISFPVEPANKSDLTKTEKELDSLSRPKNNFVTQLWIDKGNGGIYKNREELKLFFRTEVPCYLKVLYMDAGGNKILMYPTQRDPGGKLEAGVIHELHRNNFYTIQPPFGSELIVAFASTEPLTNQGEKELGQGYRGYTSQESAATIADGFRGLGISERPQTGSFSETRVFLTSVE